MNNHVNSILANILNGSLRFSGGSRTAPPDNKAINSYLNDRLLKALDTPEEPMHVPDETDEESYALDNLPKQLRELVFTDQPETQTPEGCNALCAECGNAFCSWAVNNASPFTHPVLEDGFCKDCFHAATK